VKVSFFNNFKKHFLKKQFIVSKFKFLNLFLSFLIAAIGISMIVIVVSTFLSGTLRGIPVGLILGIMFLGYGLFRGYLFLKSR
jgi:hypothetical protein